MKPFSIVAFFVAGCTWGWFLGGCISATDSNYLRPEESKHIFAFLGLIAGMVVGSIGGSMSARFLPKKFVFVPAIILVIGLVPLGIVAVATRVDAAQYAKDEVLDRKRDEFLHKDAKNVLDSFSKATGWEETGSYWNARWYDLIDDPTVIQAQLVSLGAVDIHPIPGGTAVDMRVTQENHSAYVQLTPKTGGGSHVMIQY